jgi:hypothetical protein
MEEEERRKNRTAIEPNKIPKRIQAVFLFIFSVDFSRHSES